MLTKCRPWLNTVSMKIANQGIPLLDVVGTDIDLRALIIIMHISGIIVSGLCSDDIPANLD